RFAPKAFAIEAPDGSALPNPIPAELAMLYRLPQLVATSTGDEVYIAEGEKDADALAALGLVATSGPCGTHLGWLPQYSSFLAGRHVVVLPDADGPGRRYADSVQAALAPVAASVVIVRLPHGLREGKSAPWDVSDWFARSKKRTRESLAREVATARFRGARPDEKVPTGNRCRDLVFESRLGAVEKLILLSLQRRLSWD